MMYSYDNHAISLGESHWYHTLPSTFSGLKGVGTKTSFQSTPIRCKTRATFVYAPE